MPYPDSPVGLGLSLPQQDSIDQLRHLPDLAAWQGPGPPAFAAITPHLTASVAPSPSPLLPDSAQTILLRAQRFGGSSLTEKSPVLTPGSLAVDAAFVAGSVSVLVGVGGLVGVVCYRRKRHNKSTTGSQSKSRKKGIKETKDVDDVEASPALLFHDPDSYDVRPWSSMFAYDLRMARFGPAIPLGSTPSPSLASSTPSMVPSSMLSSAPMLEHVSPSSWASSDPFSPSTIPFSSITAGRFRARAYDSYAMLNPQPQHDYSELGVDDEVDLGIVALSSLSVREDGKAVESYDDENILTLFDAMVTMNGDSSVVNHASFESSGRDVACTGVKRMETRRSQTNLPASPVSFAPELRSDATTNSPDSSFSDLPLASSSSRVNAHPTSISHTTRSVPTLLELMLESHVNLRSCLGLGIDEAHVGRASDLATTSASPISWVSETTTTDSQKTYTGTNESFDQASIQDFSEKSGKESIFGGNIISHGTIGAAKESRPEQESKIAGFKHNTIRTSVGYAIPASSAKVLTVSSSVSKHTATSPPSSCASVMTLKLPSFRTPGFAPLTEEMLPPPSIIVSVPTDGSIMRREGLESLQPHMARARPQEGKQRTAAVALAKVMFDPVDESEDEVWGDAYERTCFVEGGAGTGGLGESWLVSSESSELDIEEAIAKFPLPPDQPTLLSGTS